MRACEGEVTPERLGAAIETRRAEELRLGHAVLGPHRDDLRVQLAGRPVGRYGSAGEQRRVAIALKLAMAELLMERKDSEPVMLVDDVDAELDDERMGRVIELVQGRCQALITTSKPAVADRYAGLGSIKRVQAGAVTCA